MLPCPWHICKQDCCTLLGAAGRAGQHRNSILSSFGEKMTAAKKNIEELTHSSKLIFFNVVFPTPVAQGMLWTSLSHTHCTQMMSAHLTQMQARVRVFLSFPVQLRLPFPGKAGKSCYPVWWNLIISCECSSQSWYVWPQKYQNMRGFSGTLLGDQTPLGFFPRVISFPWVGELNQQHQWQNERSCYSPVQGGFPILHEEQKALKAY